MSASPAGFQSGAATSGSPSYGQKRASPEKFWSQVGHRRARDERFGATWVTVSSGTASGSRSDAPLDAPADPPMRSVDGIAAHSTRQAARGRATAPLLPGHPWT